MELIERETKPFLHLGVGQTPGKPTQALNAVIGADAGDKNVNECVNGVVPVTLKVYEWFDENHDPPLPGLTHAEVNIAVGQGKVANNVLEVEDPDEIGRTAE